MPSTPTRDRSMLSVFAALTAVACFMLATAAIVAVSAKSDTSVATSAPVAVTLTEYKITPAAINASGHVQLNVTNGGTMPHNLSVPDLGKATKDLAPGASQTLDLGNPAPGTYKVLCTIVGHEALGMVGTLVVTAGGSSSADAASGDMAGMDTGAGGDPNDPATLKAMSDKMQASFAAFPAKTEGLGNVPLVPTVDPDGTKVFAITAAITDWEVQPGKVVKAWTYNGTVPGPLLKANVGDKVRIDVTNNLPGAGTDVHLHGIQTEFAMDGVAPITQDIIPGDGGKFSYTIDADHAQVGMYHAHNMGETAVPNGMFGAFLVGDMPLPAGKTVSGIKIPADLKITQDIPMVLNDAGVIGLSLNGKAFPATAPVVTNNGDWIQVQYFNEGLAVHPMHQHEFPGIVIAKDGLPLDSPYAMDTLLVAPGERYTVLYHTNKVGTWVWHCHILTHAEGPDGMLGMVTAMVVK